MKFLYITLSILALLAIATYLFMQQASFGKNPSGARLERIKKSKNYRDGAFQNIHHTPNFGDGYNFWKILKLYFDKGPTNPENTIPSKKVLFGKVDSSDFNLTWLGHSSYIIQTEGKTIVIDPVIAGNASPVSFFGKAYPIEHPYTLADLPSIDYLIITHDHYDHLDYKTIVQLKDKVKHIYTSLGVGSHLEYWGVPAENITELDWSEFANINEELKITALPARHFSGRGFTRNQTLWSSFVLKTKSKTIYLGGDSGYDDHFKTIGKEYGPFDLSILECGQYNPAWGYIHMMPEEVAQAAEDLGTKLLLPVHWAKFTLALHTWSEPIERVTKAANEKNIAICTPMIGETITLNKYTPNTKWWE
jgi:L-ascorbate metabolism protein UlaG (beta-lactamase superfamily)